MNTRQRLMKGKGIYIWKAGGERTMAVFRLVLCYRLFAVFAFTSVWLYIKKKKSAKENNNALGTDRQSPSPGKEAGP